MPTLTLRRRDPWWGQEGPAARRRHRYEQFVSTTAFLASLVALGGAGLAWAIQLGFAAMVGVPLTLALADRALTRGLTRGPENRPRRYDFLLIEGGAMRTLIANGTVVTADGSYAADVLVDGETIVQIGAALGDAANADETIDATGKYVIPGGIDVHTHMELPFGGTFAKDTFETGTRAAAFGGTTTIVDFAVQSRGASLRAGLDAWHAKAEGNAVADYGFHMIMSDVNDDTLKEMDALVAEGVPDFKLFTAYPGVFYSDDGAIFRAMQQTAKNGGLIMMHAENGMAIDVVAADTVQRRHDRPDRPRPRALRDLRGRGDEPRDPARARRPRCPSTSSTCPRRRR